MNLTIRLKLSVMMFFEYFIWGVYFVALGVYLGKINFTNTQIGDAYFTQALGAIISPFFIGMIADKFFNAEKVLAVMHIIGGVLLYWVSNITTPLQFVIVLSLYMCCYMPTIALTNSIALNQMQNPGKEFPSIRVLGTIGWIVANLTLLVVNWFYNVWIVGVASNSEFKWQIEWTNYPIILASVFSILFGLYSFYLPTTPPKRSSSTTSIKDILGLQTLQLMKDKSFAIFVISSFLISIPLAAYYTYAGRFLDSVGVQNIAGKMSMGQMSEVLFMLVMPFFFFRLGIKNMLLIGMLAWAIRYLCFAVGVQFSMEWLFIVAIVLHGICYDFFFVTGQIYVDKTAPKHIQANAQGFITIITYGAGMGIGMLSLGRLLDDILLGNWISFWLITGSMALLVMLVFAFTFKPQKKT